MAGRAGSEHSAGVRASAVVRACDDLVSHVNEDDSGAWERRAACRGWIGRRTWCRPADGCSITDAVPVPVSPSHLISPETIGNRRRSVRSATRAGTAPRARRRLRPRRHRHGGVPRQRVRRCRVPVRADPRTCRGPRRLGHLPPLVRLARLRTGPRRVRRRRRRRPPPRRRTHPNNPALRARPLINRRSAWDTGCCEPLGQRLRGTARHVVARVCQDGLKLADRLPDVPVAEASVSQRAGGVGTEHGQ